MRTEYLIPVDEFCASNDIEVSFIQSLQETGLIEITTIEDSGFFSVEQLQQMEKYMRFYYELNFNLEGIDAIRHLLERVNNLQQEITAFRNRFRLYANDFRRK
jgi:hypothetical protein